MSLETADTFARLIGLLHTRLPDGAPDIACRIGAILGLETLAEASVAAGSEGLSDQGRLHVRIMDVLLAYLRQECPASAALARPACSRPGWTCDLPVPRADVQMALSVLARRGPAQRAAEACLPLTYTPGAPVIGGRLPDPDGDDGQPAGFPFHGGWRPDLQGINLQRADLTGAWLVGATLDDVPMEGALLSDASLIRASLGGTRLSGALLRDARLSRAVLVEADLTGASLMAADLSGATLANVCLEGVDLTGANLRGASVEGSDLEQADLTGVRR